MKRAQILLEDWQLEWLKERARKERLTVSAFLRKLVTEQAEGSIIPEKDPFVDLAGSLAGPPGRRSEEIDERLYRT